MTKDIAGSADRQDERITELEANTANLLDMLDEHPDNTQKSYRIRVLRVIKDLQEAFKE